MTNESPPAYFRTRGNQGCQARRVLTQSTFSPEDTGMLILLPPHHLSCNTNITSSIKPYVCIMYQLYAL